MAGEGGVSCHVGRVRGGDLCCWVRVVTRPQGGTAARRRRVKEGLGVWVGQRSQRIAPCAVVGDDHGVVLD